MTVYMNVNTTVVALTAVVAMYFMHRTLKAQYHQHCSGDLLRVVFFSQSSICSNVDSAIRIVEMAVDQTAKIATAHMLELLTSAVKGGFLNRM